MSSWLSRCFDARPVVTVIGLFAAALALMVPVANYLVRPQHSTITAPDGDEAILVTCHGPGDCFRHAAKVCPKGYEEVSRRHKKTKATHFIGTTPHQTESWSGALIIRCL